MEQSLKNIHLLKTPNIKLKILNQMDMIDPYTMAVNFNNFERIMAYDQDLIKYNVMISRKQITFEERKEFILAHIKYFYDIDFRSRFMSFYKMYQSRRRRFTKDRDR